MIRKSAFFIIAMLFVFPVLLFAEGIKTAVVLDFKLDNVSKQDGYALCELLSFNMNDSGACLAIGPAERSSLLKDIGYSLDADDSDEYIREKAALINADIVLKAWLKQDKFGFHFRLVYIDVKSDGKKELEKKYSSLDELVDDMRYLVDDFPGPGCSVAAVPNSCYFREQMMFVLPAGQLDGKGFAEREFIDNLLHQAAEAENIDAFTVYADYNAEQEAEKQKYFSVFQKSGCDTLVCIVRKEDKSLFSIFDRGQVVEYQAELFSDNPQLNRDYEANEYFSGRILHASQKILFSLFKHRRKTAAELDRLELAEELLAKKISLVLYYRIFSAVIAPEYMPVLNLPSVNGGIYWYYSGPVGLGIEYGFSIGYPGTQALLLADHPLVTQHEIRIVPFRLRTAGVFSILVNIPFTFHFHNACTVTSLAGGGYEFGDNTWLFFVSGGISVGASWNINARTSLYFDIVGVHALLYKEHIPNPDIQDHLFAGEFGGFGLIYRF